MDKQAIDYYAVLGVDPKAGSREIDQAYKALARKKHPDRFSKVKRQLSDDPDLADTVDELITRAEEEFKLVNEAYQVLTDKKKKEEYDKVWQAHFSKPQIEIKPETIDFGEVFAGQTKKVSFQIDNNGGPVGEILIDWLDNVSWAELVILPDQENFFPVMVTIKVISGNLVGEKEGAIKIQAGGYEKIVSVKAIFPEEKKEVSRLKPRTKPRIRFSFSWLGRAWTAFDRFTDEWGGCIGTLLMLFLVVLFCVNQFIVDPRSRRAREQEDIALMLEGGEVVTFLKKEPVLGPQTLECLNDHSFEWCEEAVFGVYEITSFLQRRYLSLWWASEEEFENCTNLNGWTLRAGEKIKVYCFEELQGEPVFGNQPPCLVVKEEEEGEWFKKICASEASETD